MEDFDALGEEIDRAPCPAACKKLKNQGMGTGLSHSKGELMMEEPAGVAFHRGARIISPDWIPFGVIICGMT